MPWVTLGDGRRVSVGDEFLSMTPEQQNASIEEISAALPTPSFNQKVEAAYGPKALWSTYERKAKEAVGQMGKGARGLMQAASGVGPGMESFLSDPFGTLRSEGQRMGQQAAQSGYAAPPGYGPLGSAASLAAGAIGAAWAPFEAIGETYVSKPIEDTTGIPKEWTNFAIGLAAPEAIIPAAQRYAAALAQRRGIKVTPEDLAASAKGHYQSPEVQNVRLTPASVKKFYDDLPLKIEGRVNQTDISAGTTFKTVDKLAGRAATSNNPVTIDDLLKQRRLFQTIAQNNLKRSGSVAETQAASAAIKEIDDFIANPGSRAVLAGRPADAAYQLQQAHAETYAGKTFETLDSKQFVKELRAAAANSGMNVGNSLRQGLVDLLANPSIARNLKPKIREAMEDVARGTGNENSIRMVSNMLAGGGGVASTGLRLGGASVLGPVGAFLPEIGTGLRLLSNRVAVKDVERLKQMIAQDSPLGRAMRNALTQYVRTATAVTSGAGAKTALRMRAAVEELRTQLANAGIQSGPIPIPAGNQNEAD